MLRSNDQISNRENASNQANNLKNDQFSLPTLTSTHVKKAKNKNFDTAHKRNFQILAPFQDCARSPVSGENLSYVVVTFTIVKWPHVTFK